VQIASGQRTDILRAQTIVQAVCDLQPCDMLLVEGGTRLLGTFLEEGLLDELFLTLSPQIAGRDTTIERPGLVTRTLFAPERPLWGILVSVKRGRSHLFLRYAFTARELA
jgi:riboflavin biosynthesis pyrimidine reductase